MVIYRQLHPLQPHLGCLCRSHAVIAVFNRWGFVADTLGGITAEPLQDGYRPLSRRAGALAGPWRRTRGWARRHGLAGPTIHSHRCCGMPSSAAVPNAALLDFPNTFLTSLPRPCPPHPSLRRVVERLERRSNVCRHPENLMQISHLQGLRRADGFLLRDLLYIAGRCSQPLLLQIFPAREYLVAPIPYRGIRPSCGIWAR